MNNENKNKNGTLAGCGVARQKIRQTPKFIYLFIFKLQKYYAFVIIYNHMIHISCL